ncbi:MAG TPA: beta-L-arabinofuranosidase domain-containing protein [Vicinamibacteria bacterium]|nr:beta-L-arabinofuranosidase domain-containing protein [Vicinamibacteria bacterium]
MRAWLAVLAAVTGGAGSAPKTPPAQPDAARPLPLTAVRLTGGPLKRAQDLDAEYLLGLQPDRMLAFYRQRAGLAPKAEPYAGWEGDGRNLTGHIAGHYLSAVSLMWSATGDVRFKERADDVVKQLKEVQDRHGDGFLMAQKGARECFDRIVKGEIRSAPFDLNGLWVPWYVFHKTVAGLRDAYRHAGNPDALAVAVKAATWVEGVLGRLDDAQVQTMLGTEFGGMPEVLADLYADTGDERWLALSRRFDHRAVLDPLLRGEDHLAGLHGNTNIPKLVAAAVRFGHAGDPGDRRAAEFFWQRVVRHHTFATGGHSKDEHFREPDRYGEIVDGRTAESCNVYNMLKLTRRLFALQPRVEYAEFLERALFNHVLGSIDPADGATCYMVPVGRGVTREYADMQRSFTCCVGTGMENHALHGLGIYHESADRLWVNLYVPSRAEWSAAGTGVTLETDLPEGEAAMLTLALAAPRRFTLALRRPAWAGPGFAVRVNGEEVGALPAPPAYVELDRTWKDGDQVRVTLPKSLRLEPAPDNPRRVAILWGPLVLAGNLGLEPDIGDERRGLLSQPPPLITAERPVAEWVKPAPGRPGEFRTEGALEGRDLPLVPFYRLHRRVYAAYFDLFTPAEWEKQAAGMAAERQRQQRLERATLAFVRPGEAQAERDFNLQGEETSVFVEPISGRRGRRGRKWFAFDVPVTREQGAKPLSLVVTYHSDQPRARRFEILVDGTRVAEQTLPPSGASRFLDVEYPLPPAVLEGKRQVTVRFQAAEDREIASVFGIRMVHAQR